MHIYINSFTISEEDKLLNYMQDFHYMAQLVHT